MFLDKKIIKQDENREILYNSILETEKCHPKLAKEKYWFLDNVKTLVDIKRGNYYISSSLNDCYKFITRKDSCRHKLIKRYGDNFEEILKDISSYVDYIVLNKDIIIKYLVYNNYSESIVRDSMQSIQFYKKHLAFIDKLYMDYAMFRYFMSIDIDIKNIIKFDNKIKNVKVNVGAWNKCRDALLSGVDFTNRRNKFVDEDVCMVLDIGNYRDNQEDACMYSSHDNNNDFKIIAVADGVGGLDKGEFASYMALSELKKWFKNLNESFYYYPNELANNLRKEIGVIDSKIFNSKKCGCTTLSVAVICSNSVIIVNIGDSRIYNLKDRNLEQLTKDDSLVWRLYEANKISETEIPFHKNSNVITKCLGNGSCINYSNDDVSISMSMISKDKIDTLLLCTDGISDLIPRKIMGSLMINSYNIEIMATKLVDYALAHDSKLNDVRNDWFSEVLYAGKDNATCAICKVKRR